MMSVRCAGVFGQRQASGQANGDGSGNADGDDPAPPLCPAHRASPGRMRGSPKSKVTLELSPFFGASVAWAAC